MSNDPEITAMGTIADALGELDDDARRRVLEWSAKKYGVRLSDDARVAGAKSGGVRRDDEGDRFVAGEHTDFVDLFDAANPKNDAAKALVGGYWFQVVQVQPSFDAQQVNNALKDVGHGVGNITQALTGLQNRKPALVRQMAKSGRTKQARKTYKLTTSGIAEVRKMVEGEQDGE